MRKSLMPSVVKMTKEQPTAAAQAGPSTASRAGATDEGTIRRTSAAPFLYSEDDLTNEMRRKLTDNFRPPQQDASKIQQFDPARRQATLGPAKIGMGPRPPRSAPISLPIPVSTDSVEEPPEGSYEPLMLWAPPEPEAAAQGDEEEEGARRRPPIMVDPILCRFLRPHQREGVQFSFDCVMGLREYEGAGCILADDMGLGKTLQSIAILWTLMCQGFEGKPAVTHTIIACPVSLVTNWESELTKKWIGAARLRQRGMCALAGGGSNPLARRTPHAARPRTPAYATPARPAG